jgi:hypothetical protein
MASAATKENENSEEINGVSRKSASKANRSVSGGSSEINRNNGVMAKKRNINRHQRETKWRSRTKMKSGMSMSANISA